ncbi:Uncharacterised protein [Mycobacteroides abscessus subsp. abscessus]|nr:Uncharacterised protein [Mycobacteroides abscessus subsp. abscessus]
MIGELGVRRWIAWRLVQLARLLYDAEWREFISIETPDGKHLRIDVVGDEYGCGISSTSGINWDPTGAVTSADVSGLTFRWHDAVRPKDLG